MYATEASKVCPFCTAECSQSTVHSGVFQYTKFSGRPPDEFWRLKAVRKFAFIGLPLVLLRYLTHSKWEKGRAEKSVKYRF